MNSKHETIKTTHTISTNPVDKPNIAIKTITKIMILKKIQNSINNKQASRKEETQKPKHHKLLQNKETIPNSTKLITY